MNDERIVRRTLLRGEELLNRLSIERVRAESVHGFGWKGNQAPLTQAFGGSFDHSGVRVRWVHT